MVNIAIVEEGPISWFKVVRDRTGLSVPGNLDYLRTAFCFLRYRLYRAVLRSRLTAAESGLRPILEKDELAIAAPTSIEGR